MRLTPSGEGPRTLYTLAVRYRRGDREAGWEFATAPQIEALISRQVRAYSRYPYVKSEDLEDLRSELRLRVLGKLADKKFNLPEYHDPKLNEAALVSYFALHTQELACQAIRLLIGPNAARSEKTATGYANVPMDFSQMSNDESDFMSSEASEDLPIHADVNFVQQQSTLAVTQDPLAHLDRNRRVRVLTMAQKFFQDDHETALGYSALWHSCQGAKHWGEVAEAIGLSPSRSRYARMLALRFRNIMKAAAILAGEDVGYRVLGIYTSEAEAGLTALSSTGAYQSWTFTATSLRSPDAFAERIRKVLSDGTITFAVMNLDDHSSAMRRAALKSVWGRDPLIEKFDTGWLEVKVTEALKGILRLPDAKRRSLLLAHAKHAECQIRGRAA